MMPVNEKAIMDAIVLIIALAIVLFALKFLVSLG